jgi:amidophosphoribosyltransferase
LLKSVGLPEDIFCTACFTGDYPIPVQLEMDKLALENAFADPTTNIS